MWSLPCGTETGQQNTACLLLGPVQPLADHACAVVHRRYHDHVVAVVSRLVDGIKAKGSAAAIDVSDISQRESFDVIGMVRLLRPQKHKACTAHMEP